MRIKTGVWVPIAYVACAIDASKRMENLAASKPRDAESLNLQYQRNYNPVRIKTGVWVSTAYVACATDASMRQSVQKVWRLANQETHKA